MEDIIQDEAERVCTPAPPEERAVVESFKSAVASVDAEYLARVHRKRARRGEGVRASRSSGVRVSTYRAALDSYLQLFNAPLTTRVRHYCWDAEKARPCCRNRDEMCDKLCEANTKLFMLRRPETPTQKEWTRIRLACCWLLVGLTKCLLLARGVKRGVENLRVSGNDDRPPVVAHALGAGEDDHVRVNASRLDLASEFLNDPATPPLLCSIVLASGATSSFMYALLSSCPLPTAQQMLGVRESRVGKLLSTMLDLVEAWLLPMAVNPWSLMACWSTDFANDENLLRVVRRLCLSIIAGVYWRFDRFYSDFPYRLHLLLDTGASAEELAEAIRRWGVGVFDLDFRCCLDWCTRQIVLATGSEDELAGPFGKSLLRTLFLLIRWGIAKVERLHAQHRHWAQYQGCGNRSIVHVSCRHQLYEQWVGFKDLNEDAAHLVDKLLVKDADKLKDIANALRSDGEVGRQTHRKGIGGNPKWTMRNEALKAAKEAKGGEKLTADEVRQTERDALEEYERMRHDPDEYHILYEQYRQEHLARAQQRLDAQSRAAGSSSGPEASGREGVREFGRAGEQALGADDPVSGFVPVWRHGGQRPHWPTDTKYIDEDLEVCSSRLHRSPAVQDYYRERSYHVMPPDLRPPTASPCDWRGCSRKPPFVCRARNRIVRAELDAILRVFNEVVRAVGKERAEDASVLLRLDGEGPRVHDLHDRRLLTALGGRLSTFFVLLVLPFYQPWVQVFVVGVAEPEGAGQEAPAEPPYTVRACVGPSLISRHFRSVVCSHTGALAEHMARTFARWTITRMRERPLTPLAWRVLGREGVPVVVDAAAIAATTAVRRSEVLRELASLPVRVRVRRKTRPEAFGSYVI